MNLKERLLAFMLAMMIKRSTLMTQRKGTSSVRMAVEIIILTLIIGISGFFVATTIPPALTIIATAALVSVSGAVASLLQTVLSIAIVGVIILLYVAVIYHVISGVTSGGRR